MPVYTPTHRDTWIHTDSQRYLHTPPTQGHLYMHKYTCTPACTPTHSDTWAHINTHLHLHIHKCTWIPVHNPRYMDTYIYTNTHVYTKIHSLKRVNNPDLYLKFKYFSYKMIKAGRGDECLWSQHVGSRDRRIIANSKPGCSTQWIPGLIGLYCETCLQKTQINR